MSEDAITRPALRIGIVGWGWMGQVHARAYARLRQHYPDAPMQPRASLPAKSRIILTVNGAAKPLEVAPWTTLSTPCASPWL